MVPEEKYYVRPAKNDKDQFGFPALEVHISFEENVLDNMVKAREHLMQLMQDAGHKGAIREIVPTLVPRNGQALRRSGPHACLTQVRRDGRLQSTS